jgi:hypothetical protein
MYLRGRKVWVNILELQAVRITENEVDLAPRRAEVGREKLQPLALELPFGRALAQLAMAEVERLPSPTPPRFNARSQIHVMPAKDCFDRGPGSFYNCLVPKTTGILLR